MFTNNRDAYRQAFFNTWQKYQKKLPLAPLEIELIEIILLHAEYSLLFDKPDHYREQEFELEENPFFHLSLHIAIREQLRTQRPHGINEIYQKLMHTMLDAHQVEHKMMHCLAQMLLLGQEKGEMPSDAVYLEMLKKLI